MASSDVTPRTRTCRQRLQPVRPPVAVHGALQQHVVVDDVTAAERGLAPAQSGRTQLPQLSGAPAEPNDVSVSRDVSCAFASSTCTRRLACNATCWCARVSRTARTRDDVTAWCVFGRWLVRLPPLPPVLRSTQSLTDICSHDATSRMIFCCQVTTFVL